MAKLKFAAVLIVGESLHWQFGVGRLGDRWCGFALGKQSEPGEPRFMQVLPEVSDDAIEMGMKDWAEAIRLTTAIAVDAEHGFDRVLVWYVAEELRGDPEAYRCQSCSSIGCGDECRRNEFDGE